MDYIKRLPPSNFHDYIRDNYTNKRLTIRESTPSLFSLLNTLDDRIRAKSTKHEITLYNYITSRIKPKYPNWSVNIVENRNINKYKLLINVREQTTGRYVEYRYKVVNDKVYHVSLSGVDSTTGYFDDIAKYNMLILNKSNSLNPDNRIIDLLNHLMSCKKCTN